MNTGIGGFFEIEKNFGEVFYPDYVPLNTGRNAIALIANLRKYQKVYVPYYSCNSIIEGLQTLNIETGFYHINSHFQPILDFKILKNEGVLIINYFGILNNFLQKNSFVTNNLIIDNTQAFFQPSVHQYDTIYSCRKFFGVPDGAYLFTTLKTPVLERDASYNRNFHIKRLEMGSEKTYSDFQISEQKMSCLPIKKMSLSTENILKGINYIDIIKKREDNFSYMHSHLSPYNSITNLLLDIPGPMTYPFYTENPALRKHLINNSVFVPTYWQEVLERPANNFEKSCVNNIIPIPIDHRYSKNDMEKILDTLEDFYVTFNS